MTDENPIAKGTPDYDLMPGVDPARIHEGINNMIELERLRNMQYLPATSSAGLATQKARCIERDAIQLSRPEGCFCLGAGKLFARMGVAEQICTCPDGRALHALESLKEEGLRAQRSLRTWEHCGVPKRFLECRLSTSPVERPPGFSGLKKLLECFFDDSFFLHGASGVGKTGLAVGWLHERLQAGHSVLFATVPDLLGEIKSTYKARPYWEIGDPPRHSEEDVIQKYLTVDSLVLDDLGAEQIGNEDWLQDRLYRIIGGRHDELRPTVFTSNHNIQVTGQRIGERITWRIVEAAGKENIIEIKGRNLREE